MPQRAAGGNHARSARGGGGAGGDADASRRPSDGRIQGALGHDEAPVSGLPRRSTEVMDDLFAAAIVEERLRGRSAVAVRRIRASRSRRGRARIVLCALRVVVMK